VRNNTNPRIKCWLLLVALTVTACVVFTDASVADEAEAIGEPLPSGTEPSSIPAELSVSEPPEMQSLAFPGERVAKTLSQASLKKEDVVTRGATEKGVYKKASPSVVIVLSGDGGGSGAYVGSNQIITSLHVVDGSPTADVVFKDKQAVSVKATVSKIDRQRDLALLTLKFVPSVSPLRLGSIGEIEVGDDVYAIGHPRKQWWTFTKGLVSAVRPGFTWQTEDGMAYEATVIQTQTPINPGNSGGPLLNDDAEIIGLNTFLKEDSQGLNYAVAVNDVRAFLKSSKQTPSAPSAKIPDRPCEVKKLYQGKGKIRGNRGSLVQFDTNCDGRADFSYFYPTKKSKSYLVLIDTNADGKADIEIQDRNRNGKWDISYHDTNHDGRADLVGRHPKGELDPSYYDKYAGS
jgi:S1-C subfamily serine protease